MCDNTPAAPVLINFFETILSWPLIHLVAPIGVSNIFLWPQEIQPREREKNKEQTNNKGLGQLGCKKGGSVTLYSLCICRLTRNFHKATRNADSSWLVFLLCSWTLSHAEWSLLLSVVDRPSASPFANSFSQFLFPTTFFFPTRVPLPTSGRVEGLELRPLFGFAPKQTKRSSAWRNPFIVSHMELNCTCPKTKNKQIHKIWKRWRIHTLQLLSGLRWPAAVEPGGVPSMNQIELFWWLFVFDSITLCRVTGFYLY